MIKNKWGLVLIIITLIICSTIIWINYNSWTIRFEMDNNTREAIESLNYSSLQYNERCYITEKITTLRWDIKNNVYVSSDSYYNGTKVIDCKEVLR